MSRVAVRAYRAETRPDQLLGVIFVRDDRHRCYGLVESAAAVREIARRLETERSPLELRVDERDLRPLERR